MFDATANIYIAIAALIRAGLDGIGKNLAVPPDVVSDPDSLDISDFGKLNIRLLPQNLGAAISAAENDKDLLSQFPPLLIAALLSVRRDDVRNDANTDETELARKLTKIY